MNSPDSNNITAFKRIEMIFAQVCDLPKTEADAKLLELAEGDEFVIKSVSSMLQADREEYPVLDSGALQLDHASTDGPNTNQPLPDFVGPYEVQSILGHGGMGTVYKASQSNPSRIVALKVIHERSKHAQIRKRFKSEADILARLNHPGIATIYASGIDDSETIPYVAMELIDGKPITEYVKDSNLTTTDIIKLLRDVCDAVSYAHRLDIIHRDLKPGNIMVDQAGQVKVLDFGIAIDQSIEDRTMVTQTGQLLGTLQYMAPEQIDQQHTSITSQTDVYALGLIAYELLTGNSPFTGRDSSMYDMVRAIREQSHPLLGTVNRAYKGDIETIIAKALSPESQRRYDHAGKLTEDLDRYLQNIPVVARKPSAMYYFQKFTKRNPALVSSIAVVITVLMVSVALIAGALNQATIERKEAQHQQRVQKLINEFMTKDLFATADPNNDGDAQITLLNALRLASPNIPSRFKDAPEAHSYISASLGEQFRIMNDYEKSISHLTTSVELSESLGLNHNIIVDRRNMLADVYMDTDDLPTALQIVEETNKFVLESSELTPELMIDTLVQHASLLYHMRRPQDSATVFEQALEVGQKYAPDYRGNDDVIGGLAVVYSRIDRFEDSKKFHLLSIDRSIDTLGAEHPATLVSRDNLCIFYVQIGEYDEAITQLEDIIEIRLRIFGPHHVKTYLSMGVLGQAFHKTGRLEEGEAQLVGAYNGLSEILGGDHRYTQIVMGHVHQLYTEWGKPEQAQKYVRNPAPEY
ncbi:MAG: protein kinase [Phycisphaerales bacterium]